MNPFPCKTSDQMGLSEPSCGDSLTQMCAPSDNPDKRPSVALLNSINSFIFKYRTELGYPIGTKEIPYLFLCNDLTRKVAYLIDLCAKNRTTLEPVLGNDQLKSDTVEWCNLLLSSYEDVKKNTESCSFHCTAIPPSRIELLRDKLLQCVD